MAHSFPRNRRIVKTDDFSSVFRLRPVRRTAHFVLYAKASEQLSGRLGIVVAKRLAPRAVTRNMIKRMIRETFRQTPPVSADWIVRLTAPVNAKSQPASSSAMKSALRAELQTIMASPPLSGRA